MDDYGRERAGTDDLFQVVRPIYDAKGWLRFLGVMYIIGGVLYCLTIIGAIVGWIPIWMGVLLNKAAGNIEAGLATKDARSVYTAMDNLRLLFKIMGIMMIIGIVVMFLYFGVIILLLASGELR